MAQRRKRSTKDTWRPTRRREQGHAQATADAQKQKAPTIPDHPLITKSNPQLITTASDLDELVSHVREVGQFAYDTEFIGEMTYYPHICLVQIATHERIALIDPFEDLELTPVWELIADESVETLVHAGSQDLAPVVRDINKAPANIFDTQIAAGFIAMGYPTGLSKLVNALLNVKLGKGLTYTSWDHRPISEVHQRYAADDVRYLPALKEAIDKRLSENRHSTWAIEECATLADRSLYESNPDAAFNRIKGAIMLAPSRQQVLRALLLLRDQAARSQNQPPRSVISDQVMVQLARQPVKSIDDLNKVSSLSRSVRESYGQALVDATLRAQDEPVSATQRRIRQDDSAELRFAMDGLWAAVTGYCCGCGVDPTLVVSRQELATWYRSVISGTPHPNGRLSKGWRARLLREPLAAFIEGNLQMRFDWCDGSLRTTTDNGAP